MNASEMANKPKTIIIVPEIRLIQKSRFRRRLPRKTFARVERRKYQIKLPVETPNTIIKEGRFFKTGLSETRFTPAKKAMKTKMYKGFDRVSASAEI